MIVAGVTKGVILVITGITGTVLIKPEIPLNCLSPTIPLKSFVPGYTGLIMQMVTNFFSTDNRFHPIQTKLDSVRLMVEKLGWDTIPIISINESICPMQIRDFKK